MDAGVYLYKCTIDENGNMTWSLSQINQYINQGNATPVGPVTLAISGASTGIAGVYVDPDA